MFPPEGSTSATRGIRPGVAWLLRALAVAALSGGLVLAAALDASARELSQPAAAPTVAIGMSHAPADPGPGEPVSYLVTLTNQTDREATGYQVSAVLPAAIVEATWSCAAQGSGSACGVDAGAGDLVDTADLGPGGRVVYTVFATVDPEATEVSVTANAGTTPPSGGECDPCQAGTTIGEVPTVVLSKTYRPQDPDPAEGETVTFVVSLTNDSGADAVGYLVDGQTPPAVVDTSWTCTATGAGSACGAEAGSGDLRDTADIGAGGEVVYRLHGTIASSDPFTQRVVLIPSPGQACEPVRDEPATAGGPVEEEGYHYGDDYAPAPAEAMVCMVNNQLRPTEQTTSPPGTSPPEQAAPGTGAEAQTPPQLANTGLPLPAYAAIGGAAILAGAALRWSVRRRAHQ